MKTRIEIAIESPTTIEDARKLGYTGDDPVYAYLYMVEQERLDNRPATEQIADILNDLKAKCVTQGITIPERLL
jgi:hypothetical protein